MNNCIFSANYNSIKMKKIFTLALIILASATSFGQKKNVALTTLSTSRYIDFSDANSNVAMGAALATLQKDESFDLTSSLEMVHDSFFKDLKKVFPFKMVDEKTVLSNEEYKKYDYTTQMYTNKEGEVQEGKAKELNEKMSKEAIMAYPGYKWMTPVGKMSADRFRPELTMLDIFKNDADGVLFIEVEYNFVENTLGIGGLTTASIQAVISFTLYNKDGDKVLNTSVFEKSKKKVPMVKGIPVMKPAKITQLCEDATKRAVEAAEKKLGKKVKKILKKF